MSKVEIEQLTECDDSKPMSAKDKIGIGIIFFLMLGALITGIFSEFDTDSNSHVDDDWNAIILESG